MQFCFLIMFLSTTYSKKPYNKRQQGIWRIECELGVISDPDCPVDGGWSSWGPWSPCQGSCDTVGHRRRTRDCINPPPSKDGIPCSGQDEQIDMCYLTNCSIKDFCNIVEGNPVRMKALEQLQTIPALPERCLQMECPFEAIEASLAAENTWKINPEELWNALLCVKNNVGCELSGGWSSWGPWLECDARCGRGTRWRVRRCDTPLPSAAHLICEGVPFQSDPCEGDQCANYLQNFQSDSSGQWSDWGPWSQCSEVCGTGLMKRRRICNETPTPRNDQIWGTHCRGQHKQLKMCSSKECRLNGGWSGWSAWGPCTQICGAGRRSRTRSCTRPAPSALGIPCAGPRTEVGACYTRPCETHSHTVAIMNGDSYLHYNFERKHSTMMHFYIRFKPLSPHGTLLRRGAASRSVGPLIRVSLQNWHVCIDVSGDTKSCSLRRICTPTAIEPGVWHSVMVAVTTESASIRLDDSQAYIKGTFPCDPDLPDMKMIIWIGEKLHGEIQEVILNFIPLKLKISHDVKRETSDFFPFATSNVAYEKADIDEAFLELIEDHFLRFPCFINQEEWSLELTIKSKTDSGSLIFLHDDPHGNWLFVSMQNMRLKVKLSIGDVRYDSISSTECPPGKWIDVSIAKKGDTHTIEVSIDSEEKLHLHTGKKTVRKYKNALHTPAYTPRTTSSVDEPTRIDICNDEFFVGGVPEQVKKHNHEDFTPFSGIIASLRINGVLQDLNLFSVERVDHGQMQVSSRTASVSGSYHEVVWGRSNLLNLTCLHARLLPLMYAATWLYLDTEIYDNLLKGKTVRSIDDGRVLRLVASANNDLRGFYTCRAHTNKRTHNIVTYGVMGQVKHQLPGPNMTTAIAVVTTLTLVVTAISWLIYEGFRDLRNGYGFFRDHNLSPQEEADVICDYIDQNMDLIGSRSAARLAKARARRKARQMASRLSFGAQEPEGIMQVLHRMQIHEDSTESEPELPTLPEANACMDPQCHEVYRYDHSYTSSPQHGYPISEASKLSSEPSSKGEGDLILPRAFCSHLMLTKRFVSSSSKESLVSKRASNLQKAPAFPATVKKSSPFNVSNEKNSPAHKVLQKFYELRRDD